MTYPQEGVSEACSRAASVRRACFRPAEAVRALVETLAELSPDGKAVTALGWADLEYAYDALDSVLALRERGAKT